MSETTQDSVNARIMQALHPTWINMGGYFNDGAGHGYVTPDFEESVDASLAALPDHMAVDFKATQNGFPLGHYQVILADWTIHDGRVWRWQADGATRAAALAHALEALLLATAKEDAG